MQQDTTPQKPLLRANEVAAYLGISVSSLDRYQADGDIPFADFVLGKGRLRLWKRETITDYLEKKCKNPKAMQK